MYCPKCSAPLDSDEMQRCSRCGLPLDNLKEVILGNSQSKTREDNLSPQQKGIRQGVMAMLLSIILMPAYMLLAALFPANDLLVESSVSDTPFEKISQAVLFTIFMFGLARVLYAYFFQQSARTKENESPVSQLDGSTSYSALPSAPGIPISGFGSWRVDVDEMGHSQNVPEHISKSLDNE